MKKSVMASALAGMCLVSSAIAHAAEKYPIKPITAIVAVENDAEDAELVRTIDKATSRVLV